MSEDPHENGQQDNIRRRTSHIDTVIIVLPLDSTNIPTREGATVMIYLILSRSYRSCSIYKNKLG